MTTTNLETTTTEAFTLRGSGHGQMSKIWRFRCAACRRKIDQEAEEGDVSSEIAQKWTRQDGWSLTRRGWKCPVCKRKKQL